MKLKSAEEKKETQADDNSQPDPEEVKENLKNIMDKIQQQQKGFKIILLFLTIYRISGYRCQMGGG